MLEVKLTANPDAPNPYTYASPPPVTTTTPTTSATRPRRPRCLRRASAGVAVTALTAVAKVVTPSVVATVVPTALKHQNSAIATAATVWANSFPGDKSLMVVGTTAKVGLSS